MEYVGGGALVCCLYLVLLLIFFGPVPVSLFVQDYPLTRKLRFLITMFGASVFSGLSEYFRSVAYRALQMAQRQLESQNALLELRVRERTKEVLDTQDALIVSMATLAERRDNTTGSHLKRVRSYMFALASHLLDQGKLPVELSEVSISVLGNSAMLHDIGKVGVPDHILLKPGKVTVEEFDVVKSHTIYGLEAIKIAENVLKKDNSFLSTAREIAHGHHEKWDGSGYPLGLKGKEIPFSARMMAVIDVYDALRSVRPYKSAATPAEAATTIQEGSGTHFDPFLVEAFEEIHDIFATISMR